jgi:hypothetical protein
LQNGSAFFCVLWRIVDLINVDGSLIIQQLVPAAAHDRNDELVRAVK